MIRISELTKDYYSTGEVSKMLNLNHKTAYFWCRRGTIDYFRLPNGDYAIPREEVIRLINERGLVAEEKKLKDFFYARVSSRQEEQDGQLSTQIKAMEELAMDSYHVKNPEIITDVASGLDSKRKGLQYLMDLACQGQVNRIFVLYEDRLSPFDSEYLKWYFNLCQTELIFLKKGVSPLCQQELLGDLNEILELISQKVSLSTKEKEKLKRRINQIKVDRSTLLEPIEPVDLSSLRPAFPSSTYQELLDLLESQDH